MMTSVSNSALLRGRRRGSRRDTAACRPRLDLADEPGLLVLPRRAGVARHEGAVALGEGDVAALGDGQGVVAGLGQLGEQRPHLGRRLEVVAVPLELEPVGVGHRRARLHAEQHLVGGGVARGRVVQVVGGHQRQLAGPARSSAGRRGPGSRSTGRGPSARRSSCRRRRCRGTPRRWRPPRRTCRVADRSAPHPTGSRWSPAVPCA